MIDLRGNSFNDFKRKRILYFTIFIVVILLGLASRKFGEYLPRFIALYGGDTLWALMVYFGFAFLFNNWKVRKITVLAFVFSYGIEFSQLYQGTFINSIRGTTLGALILGHGFLYSDLICYAVGILIGVVLDKIINLSYNKCKSCKK